jgi:hypothetical protein
MGEDGEMDARKKSLRLHAGGRPGRAERAVGTTQ